MKTLRLSLTVLLLGSVLGLTAQAPRLIFTEWANCQDLAAQYLELTNMEDTAIDLRDFTITHYGWWHVVPVGEVNEANKVMYSVCFRNELSEEKAMLGPGESFLITPKFETILPNNISQDRDPNVDKADFWVFMREGFLPADVKDSITHERFFRGGADFVECKYLWYIDGSGDSIAVDAINNNLNPATNLIIRTELPSIAGVDEAIRNYALVRKANIKQGNTNWDLARGTDLIDSEWLPIRYDWFNNNWNPSRFTTVGSHGDHSISFSSETLTIDHVNNTINVPWGYRKATFGTVNTHSLGLIEEIDFGPGMSYWYNEYADSSSSACQTGDTLMVYACGNDLEEKAYAIIAVAASDDNALVLPKRVFGDLSWAHGTGTIRPLLEAYTITEGVPGMDTISGIAFAERIDTLLTYIEIAPEASTGFIFIDGEDRVDLKNGDILRVTARNGSTRDYYLALEDIVKSNNANLASITWPDIPFELDGWTADTIPGFSPGVFQYNLSVPYGIDNIPALAIQAQNSNAFVKIQRAVSLNGSFEDRTTTITVTSQDSSMMQVYKVIFEAEKLEEHLQPYKAEPMISEVMRVHNRSHFVEVANVGNQDIDLSEYLFLLSDSDNPADAITLASNESTASYDKRYAKYIPGYKYGSYEEWAVKPGIVKLDPDLDPILKGGKCFVFAGMQADFLDPVSPIYLNPPSNFYDMHWSEAPYANIHGEVFPGTGKIAFPRAVNTMTLYIFKIKEGSGDSIYNGSKGINDPGDFILIDRFGGEAGVTWQVAGELSPKTFWFRKKPHAYYPQTLPKGGWGTNVDDSDWYPTSYWPTLSNVNENRLFRCSDLKNYTHDPITEYMSYVLSSEYIVDAGYTGELGIKGIVPNTNLTSFESKIIRMNNEQVLKVLSAATAGDTLSADDIIAQGDTLLVISADGKYQTRYMLNIGALDNNAVLVAKEGSGYTIDINGENATITGIPFEATLNEILDNLEKPELALLNVLDADNNLLPLKILNLSDSTYKQTIFTGGVFLEVIAQDRSKITYELIPVAASGDAWLSSNSYTVNQLNKIIYDVPQGTSAEIFLRNVFTAGGATLELLDKVEIRRDSGYLHLDDMVRVTSEDASKVVNYTFRFTGDSKSSEAFVTSDLYYVNIVETSIDSIPKNTNVTVFLEHVVPATGAYMVIKDATGTEKESGVIVTGDVLTVTSEDGTNSVSYALNALLVSDELNIFESVKLYPNPVYDILNITGLEKQTMLVLISVTGQVLKSEMAWSDTYKMDMSTLKPGYYFLRISDANHNSRYFKVLYSKQE